MASVLWLLRCARGDRSGSIWCCTSLCRKSDREYIRPLNSSTLHIKWTKRQCEKRSRQCLHLDIPNWFIYTMHSKMTMRLWWSMNCKSSITFFSSSITSFSSSMAFFLIIAMASILFINRLFPACLVVNYSRRYPMRRIEWMWTRGDRLYSTSLWGTSTYARE